MAAVSERVERQLEEIFEDRMRTDRVERKMYSFDIGAMPSLISPFVAAGVAGAVLFLVHQIPINQANRPGTGPGQEISGDRSQSPHADDDHRAGRGG